MSLTQSNPANKAPVAAQAACPAPAQISTLVDSSSLTSAEPPTKKSKGRQKGATAWREVELNHLLDVIKEIIPTDPEMWENVALKHCEDSKYNRSSESCKRRFDMLTSLEKSTTRSNASAEVFPRTLSRAREIKNLIVQSFSLTMTKTSNIPSQQQSKSKPQKSSIATADLCDEHISSPRRLSIAQPNTFQSYGKITSFHGPIQIIRCFESNPLVRETLGQPGHQRVLVVDGGGSTRCAILGDMLASMAIQNDWAGLVMNGYIRDSKVINRLNIGVKALGTCPVKSIKDFRGELGCTVSFAGVEFVPGSWLYSDEDGIVISDKELEM